MMLSKLWHLIIALAGCAIALWICSWVTRPSVVNRPMPYTEQQIRDAVADRRVVFDPSRAVSVIVDKAVHPTGQSPILSKLVQDGLLPPLADRMPTEPVVMKGIEGVGNYGGTWMCLSSSLADVWGVSFRLSGSYLFRWSTLGYPIKPFIAKSVTHSADCRDWLITLRPGTRWSDGAPYTADDILYWWKYDANDPLVASLPPPWMNCGGAFGRVEKVDAYHVRFSFDHPTHFFWKRWPDPKNSLTPRALPTAIPSSDRRSKTDSAVAGLLPVTHPACRVCLSEREGKSRQPAHVALDLSQVFIDLTSGSCSQSVLLRRG